MLGVSVVICCHNSGKKIGKVLRHLQAQVTNAPWEVILVDNRSNDDTVTRTINTWRENPRVFLRILSEPKLGLIHARKKGLGFVQFPIAAFLDDDNWPRADWVQTVSDIFTSSPQVGVLGGWNLPEFSASTPHWLEEYLAHLAPKFTNCFAIGPQASGEGDISETRGHVWGAGLCLRRAAWEELLARQFPAFCTGVRGRKFSRGEDTELCLALRLCGWKIYYSPRLQLKHEIAPNRIRWSHIRRLSRWGGLANVHHQPYRILWREEQTHTRVRIPPWRRRLSQLINSLTHFPATTYWSYLSGRPGDPRVLEIEGKLGQLFGQLKFGRALPEITAQLRQRLLGDAP